MKLTKEDRLNIVELAKSGMTRKAIAAKYDIVHQHVTKVLRQFDEQTNGEFHDQLGFREKSKQKSEIYAEFIKAGLTKKQAELAVAEWSSAYAKGYDAARTKAVRQLSGASSKG